MRRPTVHERTQVTLRVLQTSCGLLVVASLVALGQPSPVVVAYDGAATVASARPAVPTEWTNGGPLAVPTIGVVPPGMEDWFDPQAAPVFPSPHGRQLDGPVPNAALLPSPIAPRTETAASEPRPQTSPTDTTAPETIAPDTTAPDTTASQTTRTETIAPDTTAPETTAPETTAPDTTAPDTTASQTSPTETTEPESRSAEPPPAPPAPTTNERGNVLLAVGEEFTVFDGATGAAAFSIALDSVSEATCTDPASTPAPNGRLIALLVHVTTGPDLSAVGAEPEVRARDFSFLAPDGETFDEVRSRSSDDCLHDSEGFPNRQVEPGQELTGTVVLDVPTAAGTLVFAPGYLPVGAEWELGPSAAG